MTQKLITDKETDLVIFGKGNKFGLRNKKTGKVVVSPKYEFCYAENDNGFYCIITEDEKYGFLDKHGNEVISPRYDDVSDFKNGTTLAEKNNEYLLIDEQGNEVLHFPPEYIFDSPVNELTDFVVVILKTNRRKGIINRVGKVIVPFEYKSFYEYGKPWYSLMVKSTI
ncbi:MAG: WG repeat-containing protein [Bacteroidales bacterium]|jgi:hypothetical protein|nr:WG repeat-containing protein [Bacteroidales bacterium]